MSQFDYTTLDPNKPASYRQFNGVAYYFAQLHTKGDKTKTYMATRMFKAILYKFYNEQDIQKAIQGATTYLATEKLGDEILDVLDSPMGSVNDHEGVVIRDPKVSPKPYKITGKFITGGVSSDFQKK